MPAVLAAPDYDLPTRSSSGYLLRWILPRLEPVHLLSFLDNRGAFVLSAPQSDVIIATGHGDSDTLTGQNEAVILEVGKYNPREVKGKVAKLISCECGKELVPDMVSNGAICAMGYTDDFIWVMDSELSSTPWADVEFASKALMPVIDGLNALLDGKTAGEAFQIELDGFTRNAEVEEDELIKSCLEFNFGNAILVGEGGARIRKRLSLPLPFRVMPPPPLPPVRGWY
ncbi:hypothetical protein ES707_03432 [subsurface metagenome]